MNTACRMFQRLSVLGQCFGRIALILVPAALGAHFYRAGEYGLTICTAGIILFLCTKTAWKHYAAALFLLWGAVEWTDSAYTVARTRLFMGLPWLRAAGILLTVALCTALAGAYLLRRTRAAGIPPIANFPVSQAAPALTPAKKQTTAADAPGPRLSAARAKTTTQTGPPISDAPSENQASPFLQGIVFMGTFLTLFYLRRNMDIPFLLLERHMPLVGSVQLFFAAWYAAFVAGLLADPKKSRRTRRWLWLAFSCIFFIQFFLGLSGVQGMLMTGRLHAPVPGCIIFAPLFRESFSIMPVIVITATLLAGSAWCSLLCYFGPMDALAAGSRRARPCPEWLKMPLRNGRGIVLAAGSLTALGLRAAGISTATAAGSAAAFGVVSLLVMAAFSARYRFMVHCTAFCPLGIVVAMLGRLSPWRIRVERERCDNCRACELVCKYAAITRKSRNKGKTSARCSLCRDCLGVCKNKAIHLHCPGLSRHAAAAVFTGLIASLHAVFFSVAMV